ncbi:MAG: hypothetical protein LBQ38_06425, partial [Spirochaetaceae bacterium]|nr:hypothetical protein [Spirochaetaceae bacterium]
MAAAALICRLTPLYSQDELSLVSAGAVHLARENTGPYSMVERSDWSRYDNGKYVGHVYRE